MLKQSSSLNVSWSSQKKSISSPPSFFSCCRLLCSELRHEAADWKQVWSEMTCLLVTFTAVTRLTELS